MKKQHRKENNDEEVERPGKQLRRPQRHLPASAMVVHSSETDDAPHREVHEAYTEENIEKLQENASPASEGEQLERESRRLKDDGSSAA
jgi:hypothetical protein